MNSREYLIGDRCAEKSTTKELHEAAIVALRKIFVDKILQSLAHDLPTIVELLELFVQIAFGRLVDFFFQLVTPDVDAFDFGHIYRELVEFHLTMLKYERGIMYSCV